MKISQLIEKKDIEKCRAIFTSKEKIVILKARKELDLLEESEIMLANGYVLKGGIIPTFSISNRAKPTNVFTATFVSNVYKNY